MPSFGHSSATIGLGIQVAPDIVPHAPVAGSAQQGVAPMPMNMKPEHIAVPHATIVGAGSMGAPPPAAPGAPPALTGWAGPPAVELAGVIDSSTGAALWQPRKSTDTRPVTIHRCAVFLIAAYSKWVEALSKAQ
jgi:hypothetical protein